MRACNVQDNNCEGGTNKRCFACGLPVCGKCSTQTEWYLYSHKRICYDCLEQFIAVLEKRLKAALSA